MIHATTKLNKRILLHFRLNYYDKMYQEKVLKGLNKKAKCLGYILVKTIVPETTMI